MADFGCFSGACLCSSFPLEEGAAVCGFEAIIDGIHVIGQVKP
jgi:hypothetical protein